MFRPPGLHKRREGGGAEPGSRRLDDLGNYFCAGLGWEIIVTGYVLAGLAGAIALSSALRRRLSFELWNASHHLFVPMYVLTIIHTMDAKGRSSQSARSQCWHWLIGPLIIYTADRTWAWLSIRRTVVAYAKLLHAPRALSLRLALPPGGFDYLPGQ